MSFREHNADSKINLFEEKDYRKSVMTEDEDAVSEDNLVSSTNMGEDNIIIVEESSNPHSITGILNACKQKILKPYMRFLSLMGLRPLLAETRQPRCVVEILNVGYTLQVISFLVIGYFLQYMACFRRDRGFGKVPSGRNLGGTRLMAMYEETCSGSTMSSFVMPSLLHFAGYTYALVVFRKTDDDQLPVLIERVFLTSSHVPNMQVHQRQIARTLWFFVIGSFVWMIASIAIVNCLMSDGDITFKWVDNSPHRIQLALKILLIVCIVWHDIVQASVISNYCLQAQLLKSYVEFLREKLLQQPVRPLDWIRDIEEFRKLLKYLNEEIAPPVCVFTLINWVYAIAGALWLLRTHQDGLAGDAVPLSTGVHVANVVLWCFIGIVPFIQAARLTTSCDNVKTVGQEVRTRPFVHQDTPVYELNSILIYTTSLKINAKLFNLPINGRYIGIGCAVVAVCFLVIGQSHYLHG